MRVRLSHYRSVSVFIQLNLFRLLGLERSRGRYHSNGSWAP